MDVDIASPWIYFAISVQLGPPAMPVLGSAAGTVASWGCVGLQLVATGGFTSFGCMFDFIMKYLFKKKTWLQKAAVCCPSCRMTTKPTCC